MGALCIGLSQGSRAPTGVTYARSDPAREGFRGVPMTYAGLLWMVIILMFALSLVAANWERR